MLRTSLILVATALTISCFGQQGRYLVPTFTSIKQKTSTYAKKDDEVLRLDIYMPSKDTLDKRPLVIYMHGGGFSGGQRDDEQSIQFANDLAQRGFVVASISYRLTLKGKSFSCDQYRPNKIRTFQLAVEDIRSATNYLLEKAGKLGIDPQKVSLIGSSAGAEAILHAAYWDDDDLLGSSPKLPEGFRYAGLVSFAGAIVNKDLITPDNVIPMAFFHGTCDPLVPYATAPHHYCEEGDPGYMTLHGGYTLAEHLRGMGKPYLLLSHCGGGHEWASLPMQLYLPMITTFLKEQVVENRFQQLHYLHSASSSCELVDGLPFCNE
jgi:poly(3-hydroxybutyrate) depolymerase